MQPLRMQAIVPLPPPCHEALSKELAEEFDQVTERARASGLQAPRVARPVPVGHGVENGLCRRADRRLLTLRPATFGMCAALFPSLPTPKPPPNRTPSRSPELLPQRGVLHEPSHLDQPRCPQPRRPGLDGGRQRRGGHGHQHRHRGH